MTTAAPAVASPRTGHAVPRRYRVVSRREDSPDTVTIEIDPVDEPVAPFRPGQFAMLTAFGVGEVPISVSGLPRAPEHRVVHTLRAVGAVTRALHAAPPGTTIGVRGPFGTDWAVPTVAGHDVVVVAGGIGLAPLRPVLQALLAARSAVGRVALLVGARTPGDVLYGAELAALAGRSDLHVRVTVDSADTSWPGSVGLVTTLVDPVFHGRPVPGTPRFEPERTVAFVCGPEVMMRMVARRLVANGLAPEQVRVSLERAMQCGAGLCGHCQLGPHLLCRDGPVLTYDRVAPLLTVREL